MRMFPPAKQAHSVYLYVRPLDADIAWCEIERMTDLLTPTTHLYPIEPGLDLAPGGPVGAIGDDPEIVGGG